MVFFFLNLELKEKAGKKKFKGHSPSLNQKKKRIQELQISDVKISTYLYKRRAL